MARIKHLNEDQLNEVCGELFEISSSFEGLAALLEWQSGEGYLSSSELFGVGRMVRLLLRKLESQMDILNDEKRNSPSK